VALRDETLVILGKRGSSPARPSAEAANAILGTGGQLHHIYSAALKGFAASLPEAAVQSLRNNPA
jgi:aqualysin 1